MGSWLPALPVVEVEGKKGRGRHTHTHTHTQNTRQRAHCSSIHTFILSLPYLGLGLHRQTQLFLGGGEEMEEGWVLFFFSFLSPIFCLAFFCNLVRGRRVRRKLKDTKKHVQRLLFSITLSCLCSPGFYCSFFFVHVKIKSLIICRGLIVSFRIPHCPWLCWRQWFV